MRQIGAAEEFSSIGSGCDLELVRLRKVRNWRAIGVDDPFGQEIQHLFGLAFRHISGEKMIETAILADDNDDVLDGRRSLDRIGGIEIVSSLGRRAKAENGYG